MDYLSQSEMTTLLVKLNAAAAMTVLNQKHHEKGTDRRGCFRSTSVKS